MIFQLIGAVRSGSVLVHYNNAADFLDRLELLVGSILAGNNGAKNEFSQTVHTLKEYIIW